MKIYTGLFMLMALPISFSALAEKDKEEYVPHVPVEVPVSLIKLSNDGTGVVQKVSCKECDNKIVTITDKTRAFANGIETDIRNVKTNKKRMVLVKYHNETGEVLELRWFE